MIQILLFLFIGTALLISSAFIFKRWLGNIVSLGILFTAFLLINLFFENEYLHLLSTLVLAGSTAGYSFGHKKTFQFYFLATTFVITTAFSANYFYMKEYKNIDVLSRSRDTFVEMIKESSGVEEKEKKEIFEKLDDSLEIFRDLVPFSYFLNSLFISILSFFFLRTIFLRQFTGIFKEMEGIEKFRIKDQFIFGLIGGWLTVLLLDRTEEPVLYIIGLNTALILSVIYMVQAFGIIKFLLSKKGLPAFILPVSIFIILLIGVEYLTFILIILSSLGALDFWADFRKLNAAVDDNSTGDKEDPGQ